MAIDWISGLNEMTPAVGTVAGLSAVLQDFNAASIGAASGVIAGGGRRGGNALRLNSSADFAEKSLRVPQAEIYFAFAANRREANSSFLVALFSSGTAQVTLVIRADGAIEARRGASTGVLLGQSAAGLFPQGQQAQAQFRIVTSDAAGVVQIRMNGDTTGFALNLTGIDTNNAAPSLPITAIRWIGTGIGTGPSDLSDFAIWNAIGDAPTAWVGDVRCDSRPVASDHTPIQFTPSTPGPSFGLLDEAAPNDADFVASNTIGHRDLYSIAPLPHTPSAIFAVMPAIRVNKSDAGNRSVQHVLQSGATTVINSAPQSLTTTFFRQYGDGLGLDPATGAPFTIAGVNALKTGFEVAP